MNIWSKSLTSLQKARIEKCNNVLNPYMNPPKQHYDLSAYDFIQIIYKLKYDLNSLKQDYKFNDFKYVKACLINNKINLAIEFNSEPDKDNIRPYKIYYATGEKGSSTLRRDASDVNNQQKYIEFIKTLYDSKVLPLIYDNITLLGEKPDYNISKNDLEVVISALLKNKEEDDITSDKINIQKEEYTIDTLSEDINNILFKYNAYKLINEDKEPKQVIIDIITDLIDKERKTFINNNIQDIINEISPGKVISTTNFISLIRLINKKLQNFHFSKKNLINYIWLYLFDNTLPEPYNIAAFSDIQNVDTRKATIMELINLVLDNIGKKGDKFIIDLFITKAQEMYDAKYPEEAAKRITEAKAAKEVAEAEEKAAGVQREKELIKNIKPAAIPVEEEDEDEDAKAEVEEAKRVKELIKMTKLNPIKPLRSNPIEDEDATAEADAQTEEAKLNPLDIKEDTVKTDEIGIPTDETFKPVVPSGSVSDSTTDPVSDIDSDITSETSEVKPTIVGSTQSTKSYNIKITKVNLTGKITTEIVSKTSDNVSNASSITKYYTISSELCNIIKNLYSGIISTYISSSSKINDEEITKLCYRIILSQEFTYTDELPIFILCYLKMAINKCACETSNCINLNDKFTNVGDVGTDTVNKALAIRKLYELCNITTTTPANRDVFILFLIYYICLNSDNIGKFNLSDEVKRNIYFDFFNGDKFYNPNLLEVSLKDPKKLGDIIKSLTGFIPKGIQNFQYSLHPQINLKKFINPENTITYNNFQRIIDLIIEESKKDKTESQTKIIDQYINSVVFNYNLLYWLIFKNIYQISNVPDTTGEKTKKIFPTSTSSNYIIGGDVIKIKERILAFHGIIKSDPVCSSINKIINELNINDYNITEDLLTKIIVKYAVISGKDLTADNLWKCLFEHGIYTYNNENKSLGTQVSIDEFKVIIASLITNETEKGEEVEGSIDAEKKKIASDAKKAQEAEDAAKTAAEETKKAADEAEKTEQEANLKTYQNTSLQFWNYLQTQDSEQIKIDGANNSITVKNQGKINISLDGSKAASYDVLLEIKKDGPSYINTLTLSKNTLAQQGGKLNYSKRKLKRKISKRKISKRKNQKRKISKKKKNKNISNKKIYVGGEPTVYNLNDLYLLPPSTLLQGNLTSNTIRLLDPNDDNQVITLNFFAMSNSSAISSPLFKSIKKFFQLKDISEVLTAINAAKKEKEDKKPNNSKTYFIEKTKSRNNWRNSTNILYSYTTIIAANKLILLYPDVLDKGIDKIYEYDSPEKIMDKKFTIDIYDFSDLTLKIVKEDSLHFKLFFSPKTTNNNPKEIKKFTLDLTTSRDKTAANRCEGKGNCVEYKQYPILNYLCCHIDASEGSTVSDSTTTSSGSTSTSRRSFFSRTGKAISSSSSKAEGRYGRVMGNKIPIVCINVNDFVSDGNDVISEVTSASDENPGAGDVIPGAGDVIPGPGDTPSAPRGSEDDEIVENSSAESSILDTTRGVEDDNGIMVDSAGTDDNPGGDEAGVTPEAAVKTDKIDEIDDDEIDDDDENYKDINESPGPSEANKGNTDTKIISSRRGSTTADFDSSFKGGKKINNNKRLTKKKYKGGICIKQIDPSKLSQKLQDKIKKELDIEKIGGKTKKKYYKRIKNKRKTIRK
jgi:hypothetical protein